MEIAVNENNDPVNINIKGSIEILDPDFDEIKDRLFELCRNIDKDIVMDLSEVEYIDSSGIGLLTSIVKLQGKKGKKIEIEKASLKILNVLQLSSLSRVFGLES